MKDKIQDKERLVESVDDNNQPVKVLVRRPTPEDYRDSQIAYNKAFRKALDSGGLLKQKLNDYMTEQGIWSESKQKQYDDYIDNIRNKEDLLKGGGIKLSEAKQIALELRSLRGDFQIFLAEKNALETNSVEGQADNARFAELVRLCLLNPDTKQKYFPDQESYDANATQPWVIEASSALANMLYNLDPNYVNNLEENKFLKEFKFVNDDLKLIDKDGNLVDIEGRLINEDGRFIAYRTEEGKKNKDQSQVYFVNRDGKEVVAVTNADGEEEWVRIDLKERKPFLDDDGSPIATSDSSEEDDDNNVQNKRKKRSVKTEAEPA
jgi:hypothetical protein